MKSARHQNLAAIGGLLVFAIVLIVAKGWSAPYWWFWGASLITSVFLAFKEFAGELTTFRERLQEPRTIWKITITPWKALREAVVFVGFFAVAVAILPDQARGLRPVDHDHTVHFFKIWQLGEQFLSQGRLYGWSDLWFAGYPAQYLYPYGADLYVLAIRALSLGLMSLERAYAYGLLIFWFLRGYTMYLVGRRTVGATAGMVAGLLMMGDTAAFRFGGWVFAMQWGVWPQSFSVVVVLFAIMQLPGVFRSDSWRPVALFGVFMGLAMLVHPLQLVHFMILAVVLLLAAVFTEQKVLTAATRVGVAYGIGAGVASIWLLPFFSTSDYTLKYGALWETSFELGTQLYNGSVLAGSWAAIALIGIVGTVAALKDRRPEVLALGLMVVVPLATGTATFLAEFQIADLIKNATSIQFVRFVIILKPYLFLLAGFAVVRAWQSQSDVPRSRIASATLLFLITVLSLPIVFGTFETIRTKQFQRKLIPVTSRIYAADRQAFATWYAQQPKAKGVARIGLAFPYREHTMADFGTEVPASFIKLGETPSTTFKYKVGQNSKVALDATNVRYVISPTPQNQPHLKLVKEFEILKVYEVTSWTGDPFVVKGSGNVDLTSFSDERLELEAGPNADGTLRLNVSNFPRWAAYRDGQAIDIDTQVVNGVMMSGFMSVPLKPGKYVFEFEQGWAERFGFLFFVLALLLAVALVSGRPARLHAVLEALVQRIGKLEGPRVEMLFVVIFTIASLISLVLAGRSNSEFDFVEQLEDADVFLVQGSSQRKCPWVMGQHVCGNEVFKRVETRTAAFEEGWRQCIWAHPQKGKKLTLAFDVRNASKISGEFGVAKSANGNRPVNFQVAADGVEVYSGKTGRDGALTEFESPVQSPKKIQFVIDAPNVGARHFCFSASLN